MLLAAPACTGVCKGPGCESAWSAARVVSVGAAPLFGAVDVDVDAVGEWLGTAEEGSDWTVSATEDSLLFGQPEPGFVVRVGFRDGSGPVTPLQSWSVPGTGFGSSVVVGDVDGDGAWDLVVSAPERDDGRGAVFLFRDAAQGPTDVTEEGADLVISGAVLGDEFGAALVLCGDLSGDAVPDLLVGAPRAASEEGTALVGAAYLLDGAILAEGGAHVVNEVASAEWTGTEEGESLGTALACRHDLTGDGVPDPVISAPFAGLGSSPLPDAGRVMVVDSASLVSGTLPGVATRVLEGGESNAWFGEAMVGIELPTGPALVVAAPGEVDGRGSVWVWSATSLAGESTAKPLARFQAADLLPLHLGRGLGAGDLDGDGLDDLVLGAPDLQVGGNGYDAGRAWVWSGALSSSWTVLTDLVDAGLRVDGTQPFGRVGRSFHIVDTRPDVVGAELLMPLRAAEPSFE